MKYTNENMTPPQGKSPVDGEMLEGLREVQAEARAEARAEERENARKRRFDWLRTVLLRRQQ